MQRFTASNGWTVDLNPTADGYAVFQGSCRIGRIERNGMGGHHALSAAGESLLKLQMGTDLDSAVQPLCLSGMTG